MSYYDVVPVFSLPLDQPPPGASLVPGRAWGEGGGAVMVGIGGARWRRRRFSIKSRSSSGSKMLKTAMLDHCGMPEMDSHFMTEMEEIHVWK